MLNSSMFGQLDPRLVTMSLVTNIPVKDKLVSSINLLSKLKSLRPQHPKFNTLKVVT
ncbi:hypothetical protein Sjap_003256 [Stephania japonica]|uniref:Uncharacterized protein n=1 Tax=Stephania japonica TaxID=461633 RepID=A0AAP0KNK3_9MAGN